VIDETVEAEVNEQVDDTPVENEEVAEQAETVVEDSQSETEEEATPDKYAEMLNAINEKAVYKGEKMNITDFQDVIDAVQIRENYQPTHDRMTAAETRVKEMENSGQTKFMNKFLKDNGFKTFEDYDTALKVSALVDEGMSEERAKEHIEGQQALEYKNAATKEADKKATKEDDDSKSTVEAMEWYEKNGHGELTAEKVTQETWDKVNSGTPLKYALMEQMYGDIKSGAEQDVLKKLQNKSKSSMGSLSSSNEKQTKSIPEMSDAEFDKLQARVKSGDQSRFK